MKRLGLLVPLLGCTPSAPAQHPDHDKVVKMQKVWCEMLAELDGEKLSSWRHRADCQDAYPGASAVFMKPLADCYRGVIKEYGENAPDSGAIISDCSQKIMGTADPGDVSHTKLYQARCARQERCMKVSREVCDGAWEQLGGMTQALLSAQYNLRAQSEIASCLDDRACEEDDSDAEAACYEAAHAKLVWLPLSLGHDTSLGPKVD